jgi:hypothetical protein
MRLVYTERVSSVRNDATKETSLSPTKQGLFVSSWSWQSSVRCVRNAEIINCLKGFDLHDYCCCGYLMDLARLVI